MVSRSHMGKTTIRYGPSGLELFSTRLMSGTSVLLAMVLSFMTANAVPWTTSAAQKMRNGHMIWVDMNGVAPAIIMASILPSLGPDFGTNPVSHAKTVRMMEESRYILK